MAIYFCRWLCFDFWRCMLEITILSWSFISEGFFITHLYSSLTWYSLHLYNTNTHVLFCSSRGKKNISKECGHILALLHYISFATIQPHTTLTESMFCNGEMLFLCRAGELPSMVSVDVSHRSSSPAVQFAAIHRIVSNFNVKLLLNIFSKDLTFVWSEAVKDREEGGRKRDSVLCLIFALPWKSPSDLCDVILFFL